MEGITLIKKPRLRNPDLIVAWPGMGEVAMRAANYLIEKLKAELFAEIPGQDFYYLSESIVHNGILSLAELPHSRFYSWKNRQGKNDLIIFVSNTQPDLDKAEEYSNRIIALAKSFKARNVVSFAAMPQAIDHAQRPVVWGASTSDVLNQFIQKHGVRLLSEGEISGMNGLFLGIAKREGLQGFCLLGEIPLYTIQIENPKASHALLEVFCRVYSLRIDFSELAEQSHAMEEQINSLLDYLKVGPSPGPIGEEEIEKIKKSLSQLTKLPGSIHEKIEKLFSLSKQDISKANELKSELDKWNVYKDYEDRFLDLFKQNKNKGN
jgi:uncharacterized protein